MRRNQRFIIPEEEELEFFIFFFSGIRIMLYKIHKKEEN
jgi:hypothetical protein